MSKFGLEADGVEDENKSHDFATRLATFPPAAPRPRLDLPAVDAAAAPHGFVSREAAQFVAGPQGRRRRLGNVEPTRHLAIRLTISQYQRFVAYADEHQLTYHDALAKLLEETGH